MGADGVIGVVAVVDHVFVEIFAAYCDGTSAPEVLVTAANMDVERALVVVVAIGRERALIVLIAHRIHVLASLQELTEAVEQAVEIASIHPAKDVVAALKGAEGLPAAYHAAKLPRGVFGKLKHHVALVQIAHDPPCGHVPEIRAVRAEVDDRPVAVQRFLHMLTIHGVGCRRSADADNARVFGMA